MNNKVKKRILKCFKYPLKKKSGMYISRGVKNLYIKHLFSLYKEYSKITLNDETLLLKTFEDTDYYACTKIQGISMTSSPYLADSVPTGTGTKRQLCIEKEKQKILKELKEGLWKKKNEYLTEQKS